MLDVRTFEQGRVIPLTYRRMAQSAASALGILSLVALGAGPVSAQQSKIPYGGTVYAQAASTGFGTRDFNPFSTTAETGAIGIVYEPLLMYNLQGSPTIRPWLASSYAWSNHNLTLTMHLRQGVEWQNGTPFTAKDVVFTFDLLKRYPPIDTNALWTTLSGVKAEGPSTVVFTFKHPAVPLLYYIGSQVIVPESIWAHENPVTWLDPNPVGTGPFKLESFSPQEYTFVRNPHYWQKGRPYISKVVYETATSASLLLELRRGTMTWAEGYIPDVQKSYVAADPKYNHYWWGPGNIVALFPNDATPPFNNPNVRIALAYALPYAAIIRDAANPALRAADAEGLTLPAQKPWLDAALAKTYHYRQDPALALKYLAKAGYHRNAAGKLVNAKGQALSFTIESPASYTNWITAETSMAAALNALGMNVTLGTQSSSTYFADLATGHFQLDLNWMGFGPSPYFSYDSALNDVYTAPIGKSATGDVERWRSPETQRLLNTFVSTSSPAKEKAAINGLETIMVKYMPVIPVFYAMFWDEFVTRQIVGWPYAKDPYADGGSIGEFNEPALLQIHLRN